MRSAFLGAFALAMTVAGSAFATSPILPASETYFVFSNELVCITAPCPHYTVVKTAGDVVTVNYVQNAGAGVDLPIYLPPEGLVVVGYLSTDVTGTGVSWLTIESSSVVPTFGIESTLIDCHAAPCPSWVVTNALTGEVTQIAGFQLTPGLGMTEAEFNEEMYNPNFLWKGFVATGDWTPLTGTGNLFYVSGRDFVGP